ncbi:MAG: ATPase [Planctomyces sp.]|nr:ATPase [Planctomyces sp.]
MSDALRLLILSRNPLIAIETTDEERASQRVREVALRLHLPVYDWSMTGGLRKYDTTREGVLGPILVSPGPPNAAVEHILHFPEKAVYLFRDLGPHCRDANLHRTIRDFMNDQGNSGSTMIMVDALPLPDEIRRFTIRFDLDWPSEEELVEIVRNTFRRIKSENMRDVTSDITRSEMNHLVQCLRGLTTREVESVIASAIYDDYSLTGADLPRVVEAKRTLLGSTGCLENISADFDADDIGGLDALKVWLRKRRKGFTPEAVEYGLESPRGVLMLGVAGCGKSLCAKVVAADWHMPLLRLDPGMLFQKFIGESESQLRRALAQAEAMAPAILWIDEIEKAFASAASSSADGGLSKRMFGTLLSWMQDHRHPIFIIATANDISALPPELMRKGRFDEVFFVDLPKEAARKQIFEIHLRRRKQNPADFDLDELARAADGFGGSEIEQAVLSAMFSGFSAGEKLTTRHLLDEIKQTRPLSVLQREQITELREWARNRCVPAD